MAWKVIGTDVSAVSEKAKTSSYTGGGVVSETTWGGDSTVIVVDMKISVLIDTELA